MVLVMTRLSARAAPPMALVRNSRLRPLVDAR